MKRKGILFIIALIVMGIVVVLAGIKKNSERNSDKHVSISEADRQSNLVGDSQSNTKEEEIVKKAQQEVETVENYEVQIDECNFKILSVDITKESLYENMRDIGTVNPEAVENGNLASNYSYVRIKLQISNQSESGNEMGLNSHHLLIYRGEEQADTLDLYMIDSNQDVLDSPQYFHYFLDSGATGEVELLYVIPDKYLDASYNIVLQLNPLGQAGTMVFGKTKDGERIAFSPTENVKNIFIDELIKPEE